MVDQRAEGSIAEAEIKIALTAEEFARLPTVLPGLGFAFAGETELTDYYLDYTRSPQGGYNFSRARAKGKRGFVLTRKRWDSDAQGNPVRIEDECEISREEFDRLCAASPQALSLHKRRADYHGQLDSEPATVSLDCLQLNGETHYRLECELLVPPERAHRTRERILQWMRDHLPVAELRRAPSMLEMLLAARGNGTK